MDDGLRRSEVLMDSMILARLWRCFSRPCPAARGRDSDHRRAWAGPRLGRFLLCATLIGPGAQAEPPTGTVVDDVRCTAAPDQSYVLYLPSGYTADRSWPVIYCFDPAARGRAPVECLRAAAERFGYILAGSNNSRNGSWEASEGAARAMIQDTRNRFAIDDSRSYAAGFSGGARASCEIAARWRLAGVLAAGAGFPGGFVPEKVEFVFYGCVGLADFNYGEMRRTEETLQRMKVPQRLVVHAGGHQWFPEGLTAEALGWLELQAIRAERRPRDEALVNALFLERMTALRALGQRAGAFFESTAIVADFDGLHDTTEAAAIAGRLRNSDAVRSFAKAEKKAAEEERRWLGLLSAAAAARPNRAAPLLPFDDEVRSPSGRDPFSSGSEAGNDRFGGGRDSATNPWPRPTSDQIARAGPVDPYETLRNVAADVRHRASSNMAARRALECFASGYFEKGLSDESNGDQRAAMQAFEKSAVVCPDNGVYLFALARACAQVGEKAKGREALREARANGYSDSQQLATVEALLQR